MRMRSEIVGTFIDAMYAIAVTILVLDVPAGPALKGGIAAIAPVLIEYGVAFVLLFSFWVQHRRINGLVDDVERGALWLNAVTLMIVCLVPRATSLVFEFGGDVTLGALEASAKHHAIWTTAESVDLFYVVLVMVVDFAMLALLLLNGRRTALTVVANYLRHTKFTTTAVLVVVVSVSFLLPVENRYFLLAIPALLVFETEIARVLFNLKSNVD